MQVSQWTGQNGDAAGAAGYRSRSAISARKMARTGRQKVQQAGLLMHVQSKQQAGNDDRNGDNIPF